MITGELEAELLGISGVIVIRRSVGSVSPDTAARQSSAMLPASPDSSGSMARRVRRKRAFS